MNSGPDSRTTLTLIDEEIPFGAYQAIYHKLTKKTEERSKVYRDAFEITFEDIKNLNDRISQAIKQYSVKSSRCQVSHALRDDMSHEYSSFEKFKFANLSTRSCTKIINYEFDFLIIIDPEHPSAPEVAQRFKIDIKIDQDFIDKDDFNAPSFIRGMFIGRNIEFSIEYSDFSVSEAIYAIVDGWVRSLPKKDISDFNIMFLKIERYIRQYLPMFCRIAVYVAGIIGVSKTSSMKDGFILTITSIALSSLMFAISQILIDSFYSSLSLSRPMTNVCLTAGDIDRKSLVEKRGAFRANLAKFILLGIFLNIVVCVFSSYIYDAIKSYL